MGANIFRIRNIHNCSHIPLCITGGGNKTKNGRDVKEQAYNNRATYSLQQATKRISSVKDKAPRTLIRHIENTNIPVAHKIC